MERIINNQIRVGNFTSSEIVALTSLAKDKSFGKPALTYIEEKNMERRLGRNLDSEVSARPTTWGNVVEGHVLGDVHSAGILGLEYKISSQETVQHPDHDFWVGSPDGNKFDEGKTVFDLKCPMTLKSFCQLVQPLYDGLNGMDAMNAVRENHKDGDKYYWQLVSNAILTNSRFAELIVYVPYQGELQDIRDLTQMYDGPIQNKVAWINFGTDEDLPYLRKGGYYQNLNIIRFEVPQSDKDLLTQKVIEAGKLLIKEPSLLLASLDSETNTIIVQEG